MDLLLGLDLGTTNCKALAIDASGAVVASATAPTPLASDSADPQGSPEYDAIELWSVSARLIRQVCAALSPNQRIAALAVASMGEAGVLLDCDGVPLAPILTWHDRRTLPYVDWWRERLTPSELYRITGLPLDYTYSASKLLWYRDNYPQLWTRARAWLCLGDWITFCLTGKLATTHSLASRTMLLDVQKRAWSRELLQLAQLPSDLLPPPHPGGEIVGRVTPEAARVTGLLQDTPVVTGGHDHICAAVAAGAIAPGVVLDSAGTAEALMVTLDAPILEGAVVSTGMCCGCHSVADRYYLLGGIPCGAITSWLVRTLYGAESSALFEQLMSDANAAPPGANGVWFIPHLDGSGAPERDPYVTGGWLGLRLNHTRPDLARAAFEGLGYSLRALLECIEQCAGLPAGELRTVGGGARNQWWQSVKADILGVPLQVPAVTDVTAQGAALLAGIGIGVFADAQTAAQTFSPAMCFTPNDANRERYTAAYREVFRQLQPDWRGLALQVNKGGEHASTR